MNEKSCFIMGLPSAGKTTYLAALSYLLQQTDIETKLHWPSFTGDEQYFTQLSNIWLTASQVSRTSVAAQQKSIDLVLTDNDDRQFRVSFPDLSGEVFQNQLVAREISKDIATLIEKCDGCLLFVNPQEIIEPSLIADIPSSLRSHSVPEEIGSFSFSSVPTEVQLVELLQFLVSIRDQANLKIAIIVSAWDLILDCTPESKTISTPEHFIQARLPLLWQYLKGNDKFFSVKYYGVSAQGGELDSDEKAENLLREYEKCPGERMKLIDNNGNISNDISFPLWETMIQD